MTSLWRNVVLMLLQTVIEVVFINFCSQSSLKSATNWCQTERQIQQDAWGSACIARVSQQCLQENCLQVLANEQWPPNNSPTKIWMEWRYNVWGATHEAILKPSSETQNSFWIKNLTGEDMGHFSAGPINKAVLSFTSHLTRVREQWQKTF